jgi:2'-5' RNA ligase
MSPRRSVSDPAQESLAGFEKKELKDRLFFCLFPDPAAREAIAGETDALRVEHSLTGMPFRPDRLHVTLHHLGDHVELREDLVEAACAAAQRVALPAFEVALGSASTFPSEQGKNPCVLMCAEERPPVHALWRELGTQLMAAGLGRHVERDFTAHVTVLYDSREFLPQHIDPIRWTARDFALVHSLLGKGEYRILGTWALR